MTDGISEIRIRALQSAPVAARGPAALTGESFEALLEKAAQDRGVKFSAHAQTRLAGRGIELSDAERQRIEQGADMAGAKGSRDALLVMDRIGLILNVKSRTVLTALDLDRLNSRVVTNIDSAVFV
jgi:flagellar operon protein